MLRIESYVTPIILSYVDKYIKNLKPEDSQVSLWGGDAVFNNLDLRLDVLEQELKLPFSFVNGHIHELRIHVPWTKLTSEPIVITINTIECILKIKDYGGSESESSSQPEATNPKSPEFKKKQKRQDLEVPTSYVQGLISRVINNVSIVCNNVILKYVEDDIVLSINAKTLELKSVDRNWISAFTDLTIEDLLLRNLATVTDLTVCLDKRNASGKIESYQEPLLYRCSLSCRIVREFESIYSVQPIKTRFEVHCPQLHFSLSDTQLPMFLRLIELALALYLKQLQYQTVNDHPQPHVEGEEGTMNVSEYDNEDSWSSWMWSLGSSLIEWDESEGSLHSARHHKLNSVLHLGIYVQVATWVFKVTESVQQESSYYGPSKMHFTPFLKIEQQGSFISVVIKGLEAVHVQLGVSSLTVNPIGNCICGILDSSTEQANSDGVSQEVHASFVCSGRESQEYLVKSLFDERILMGARELWNYQYDWESHFLTFTEGALIEKTSAFGLDYIYIVDLPSDIQSDKLSEIRSNPEFSNLVERAFCRVVAGPVEINLNSGFYHRLAAIEYALMQYDYPPYSSTNSGPDSPPSGGAIEEEVYALESNTPKRTYSVSFLEPCIKIHVAQHPIVDMKVVFNAKKRKRNQRASSEFCMARVMPVPSLAFKTAKLEIEFTEAMYSRRLVSTAALLRPPTSKMLHDCHNHFSFKLHYASVCLQNDLGLPSIIVPDFTLSFYKKTLLLPHLWTSPNQPKVEYFVDSDQLTVSASMPQLMLLHYLYNSWSVDFPSPEDLKTHSLVDDAINQLDKFPSLNIKLNFFELKFSETSSLLSGMTTLGSITVWLRRGNQELYLMCGPESSSDQTQDFSASEKLLKGCFQIPKEHSDESLPTVLTIGILKTSLVVCPPLIKWFKYLPKAGHGVQDIKNALFFKRISDVKRKPSEAECETLRESSSTTISEARTASRLGFFGRVEKLDSELHRNWKDKLVDAYPLVKNLLIEIDIDTVTVFLSTCVLSLSSDCDLVNAVHRIYLTRSEKTALGDTTVVCVPKFRLQNAALKHPLLHQVNDVPVLLPTSAWSSGRDKLPWSLNLSNFHVYSLQGQGDSVKLPILKPVNTTATLAITPKYQGPILTQLGTVIHLDMSPLDFSGCRRQVESHVTMAESFLSLLVLFQNETSSKSSFLPSEMSGAIKIEKCSTPKTKSAPASNVHNPTVKEPATDSGVATIPQGQVIPPEIVPCPQLTKPFSDPTVPLTDTEEVEDKGVVNPSVEPEESALKSTPPIILTSWVQFTVARVSASLYSYTGVNARKLRAEIEDVTASVDLQDIYCKLKCKIANLSVLHFLRNGTDWVPGEHEGVILTGGDQLSKELKIVTASNRTSDATKTPSTSSLSEHAGTSASEISHGFLSFTLTTAQCQNIHTKWNQIIRKYLREQRFIKECDYPQYLSEVDIRMQPLDCVFFPQTLLHFITVYEPWMFIKTPKLVVQSTASSSHDPSPLGLNINNKVLPLIYLQTEFIRVFLPSKSTNLSESIGEAGKVVPPDLILIQMDSILISPQVDNPLCRIILRQDLYSAAQQAKIIGVPGSKVEDRQYQIDFVGFSISTGSWFDLMQLNRMRPRTLSCERARGENPALEWNNYDPTMNTSLPEAIHYPIVAKLDTKILAAPAIVYVGHREDTSILIAGPSLEINATTEIDVFLSLNQISLVIDIVSELYNSVSQLFVYSDSSSGLSLSSEVLDSGVDCDVSSIEIPKVLLGTKEDSSSYKVPDFVPFEILITGSKITLTVFQKCLVQGHKKSLKGWQRSKLEQRAKNREKKFALEVASTESELSPMRAKTSCSLDNLLKSTSKFNELHNFKHLASSTSSLAAKTASHKFDFEDGYDGSEEESTNEPALCSSEPQLRFLPLMYVAISQPHTFLTCQPMQQKLDVSCFDFTIKSVPKDFSMKVTEAKKLPNTEDYTSSWFETRPGDPHPKTSIPPALLMISVYDFLHKPAEIRVDVGRPFRLLLSHNKWEQIEHVTSQIRRVIPLATPTSSSDLEMSCFELDLISLLRQKALTINSISFSSSQMIFNIEASNASSKVKSEFHTSLSSLVVDLSTVRKKSSQANKELVSELCCKVGVEDLQFKTQYHSLQLQSLLKPLCLGAELKLSWLPWADQPYVEIQIHSEILQFDLGPENIFCLIDIQNYLFQFAQKYELFSTAPEGVGSETKENTTPEPVENDSTNHLCQDDLRAGMFQFIMSEDEEVFPQPYQVAFNKFSGIMIWCYPEPRALINVHIYPVPFVAASTTSTAMSDQDDESVHCALQYYDAMRDSFVTYQKFQLSESSMLQLDLPGLSEKRLLAVATVWRVCIDYADDGGELEHRTRNLVSPEALALSMKVDSLFSVAILPTIQTLLTIKKVDLAIVNNINLTGTRLPTSMKGYVLDNLIPSSQSFLILSFDNVTFRSYSWKSGHHLEVSTMFYVHVLNYKFLTNNLFLEPTRLRLNINVQKQLESKPESVDISFLTKNIVLFVNQSSIHTLTSATEAWHQSFEIVKEVSSGPDDKIKNELPAIIMTSYVFTNNSMEAIRFGQVATDENLILESGAMHLYSWRSHKAPSILQVCIESAKWKWSDPLCLENEGIQTCTISISNEASWKFLVICKKLSAGQMGVTFTGTLNVANAYLEDMEFRVLEKHPSRDKSPKNLHVYLLKKDNVSPSLIKDPYSLKVRMAGAHSWSGEIPIMNLEPNKDSFTVKIPTENKKESLSSLCRMYRERIDSGWRVLVLFSPHFVVRSHLPRPLTLHLTTPSSNATAESIVKGRGNMHFLSCDHNLTHNLTFQLSPDLEVSRPPIPISKALIEQVRHSSSEEAPTDLTSFMENLFIGPKDKWPYIDSSYIDRDFLFADQPKIDLQIEFTSLHPSCNTLVVDVRPWALIINHTGNEILLQEGETLENVWYIPSGIVFAPPKLDHFFSFGIVSKENNIFCSPLQLSKEERWYTLKFEGRIPQLGATNIQIPLKDKVCFFTVLSRYEENIQVLHLVPTYSIANATSLPLEVRPMHLHSSHTKIDVPTTSQSRPLHNFDLLETPTGEMELLETPLLFWYTVQEETNASLYEFISLQIGRKGTTDEFSHPISFHEIDSDLRVSLTLPVDGNESLMVNEAFVLTAHPVSNQVKFVVNKDPRPQMILHNNTDVNLVFGQSVLNEQGIVEEELDAFCSLPSVPPSMACYYSFPSISSRFPEVSSALTNQQKLHFSQPHVLNEATSNDALWSLGVDMNQKFDQFVSIPAFGDVKIHVEQIHHTRHVFIDPASRIEVSAKDVRSRISSKTASPSVLSGSMKIPSKNQLLPKDPLKTDKNEAKLSETSVDPNDATKIIQKSLSSMRVFYVTFVCSEFTASLRNDSKSSETIVEVLRITLDHLMIHGRPKLRLAEKLRALKYKMRHQIELIFSFVDLQIDNQLYSEGNYDFPVVLVRQQPQLSTSLGSLPSSHALERLIQDHHSAALASLLLVFEWGEEDVTLQDLDLRLKPLSLYIEDTLVYSLRDFLKSFYRVMEAPKYFCVNNDDEYNGIIMKLPSAVLLKSIAMTLPFHVHRLTIDEISILLSVHASAKLYVAVDGSPLSLRPYFRQEVFTTGYALGHDLSMHYLSSALFRAGWVVSSLDLLGNPGGFARTVGSGIRDFVQLPYEGILQGPWAFIAGITHGSLSLVKHITAGTLVSVTNLASSVARNMEKMSFDQDHQNRNEALRRTRAAGLGSGIFQGMSSFGISILGAIGGLIHQPIHAVLTDGISPKSIVGGFGRGLVGVVTKPIGGAADFVVHAGQGLLRGTGWKADLQPKTPSVTQYQKDVSNAPLKFVWKFLAALPSECRQVICAADATLLTQAQIYTPVTVILTPQVLYIVGVDEDAHQHAFSLHELEWKAHSADPTLLFLHKTPLVTHIPAADDAEPITGCPERVADYVRSTCSDPLSSDEEEPPSVPRVKLFLSPQWRSFLVASINIAARATKGKGFIS